MQIKMIYHLRHQNSINLNTGFYPVLSRIQKDELSCLLLVEAKQQLFLKGVCCCCCVASVVSDSVRSHRWHPTRLPRPRDSPGKNSEVGCHFLLQCMKVKSQSEVAQSCPTLSDPMDCSPPGSSIHGNFQARVLEWGAIDLKCQPVFYGPKTLM